MSITNLEFKSLLHAISYVDKCPICLSSMGIDNNTNAYCRLENNYLVNESRDWAIKVAIDQTNVSITETRQVLFTDSDFSGYPKCTPTNHIIGTQIACLNINCSSYRYVFSFRVCNNYPVVKDIILNTEHILFDENGTIYEITNSHSVQKTRYKVSSSDPFREDKSIEFPFIPFNHSNPTKILEKIKNLIIFT